MTREEIIGDARLLLGDCREILPTLGKVDAVVTDPPYGIGEDGGKFRGRLGQRINVLPKKDWDAERPDAATIAQILNAAPLQIIWGGNYFADMLPASKGWLYWQKLMGGDFSDGELAWTNRDRALREFSCCPKGKGGLHPTQKPVEVMLWCLGLIPEAATVCDPFMGSGSTGVACAKLGRKFIGIERDQDYFDIACSRIDDAYKQPRLFADKPAPPTQLALLDGAA